MTRDCTPTRLQFIQSFLERRSLIGMHHREFPSPTDDLVELSRTLPILEGRVRR